MRSSWLTQGLSVAQNCPKRVKENRMQRINLEIFNDPRRATVLSFDWCRGRESNSYARFQAQDFKSCLSYFIINQHHRLFSKVSDTYASFRLWFIGSVLVVFQVLCGPVWSPMRGAT